MVGTSQQLGLEREASAQLRAELGERMRETAEAQREACASMVEDADDGVPLQCLADAIREKPLVTDAKADGGTP